MPTEAKAVRSLSVRLHGRQVGIVNRLAGDKNLFTFDQDYVDDANRPTLSLSFKNRSGGLVTSVRPYTTRLPPFFSNLLPEGPLRTYLAEQAGVSSDREFFLMAALGADVAGAVTVEPLDDGREPLALQDDKLEANDERSEGGRTGVLRFSLAGVQLKFSAVLEAHGGLTLPADGVGGSWIVKLPAAQYQAVPENELAMLALASAVGINVPEARLVPVEEIHGLPKAAAKVGGKALAVKRFDRGPSSERIHMEDFAQVFGMFPESKYERRSYANIGAVLWSEAGEESAFEFVRRLAFSVVIGNGDMHLKNWSLLYPDGRTPRLSPAYDLVSTVPYIEDDSLALTFGGSRSLNGVSLEQVRRFADRARLPVSPVWDIVQETKVRTAEAWKSLAEKELIPVAQRSLIERQILRASSAGRKG